MPNNLSVYWIDHNRDPQCAPDPNYPNGKAIDISVPGSPSCAADLPYPARRCGVYVIECRQCGFKIGLTTAGRPDDPRSIRIPCFRRSQ